MNFFRAIMRERYSPWILLAFAFSLAACDDEGGGGNDKPIVRVGGEEAGMEAGVTSGNDAGTEAGVEAGTNAGVMAGTNAGVTAGANAGTEPPRVRTIETCEELCGVYEMCEAPDDHPWGECLSGCMGEDWEEQRFRSYVSCLKLEPCETISACRIPPAPLPSCDEACAQLDLCEIDYQLPTSITQMGNCSTACGDESWARQISSCVQSNERRLCDDPSFFDHCILETRGGDCYSICQAQAGCDDSLDITSCTVECLTEAPSADALAAYRQEQRRNCVMNANGCEEVDACLLPPTEPANESAELVCTAAEACEVFAEGVCPEIANNALRELSPEGINCLTQSLEMDCSAELTDCFSATAPPATNACSDYCFIGSLCGTLPMGQSEFDCVEECEAASNNEDPSVFAPFQAQVACIEVDSCEAFSGCVSGLGESDACADLCAQRASCGVEEEGECLARCANRYATERSRRERTCGALLSCESSSLCQIPEAPNCDNYCQPLAECGLADPSCITQCDNAELYNPESHLPALACVNSSERCDLIAECQVDTRAGQGCINYCAYAAGCIDGDLTGAPTEDCVLSCARGELGADQSAEFIPARDCIAALDTETLTCGEVSGCFREPSDSCVTLCELANTCALPLSGELASNCVAACELGDVPDQAIICALNAEQRDIGCGGVAECLGFPVPEPTPACAQYCDALKSCDPMIDLYTCHARCIEDNSGDRLRAACTEIAGCDTIDRCQDQEAVSPVDCLRACQDLDAACMVTGEGQRFTDLNACADQCGGVVLAIGDDAESAISECIDDAVCEEESLDACFIGQFGGASAEVCQRSWAILQLCDFDSVLAMLGLPPLDEAQFYIDCAAEYEADSAGTLSRVECLEQEQMIDPSCTSGALNCGFF